MLCNIMYLISYEIYQNVPMQLESGHFPCISAPLILSNCNTSLGGFGVLEMGTFGKSLLIWFILLEKSIKLNLMEKFYLKMRSTWKTWKKNFRERTSKKGSWSRQFNLQTVKMEVATESFCHNHQIIIFEIHILINVLKWMRT